MSDINVIVNDEIVNIDIVDEPVLVNVINSPGVPGAPGQGVPVGGTTGQVLAKNSATNYDTEWVDVSGGAWGTITGTLSNQTDLQSALDGKFDDPTGTTAQYLRGDGSLATFPSLTGFVPYTGATGDVNLGTHRILAQNATFSSSGSGDTVSLTHSSGSGIGLNITKGGNGEGLYINKTSGSGNAATIIGTLNATSLVKSGGTSSQFLKADGTADSTVYVPTSTTLTINGVSYDLSANRSWTVAGGISGSGASGQVAYWDGTTSQAGSNNLFWDAAQGRLGVGTNTPNSTMQVVGSSATTALLNITNNSTAQYPIAVNILFPNITTSSIQAGAFYTGKALTNKNGYGFNYIHVADGSNSNRGSIAFNGADNILSWFATGNLSAGGTTDSGQRLQVQGTTLLNGNVTFSSATGMFWDATNSRLGIGTNAPAFVLDIAGNVDGLLRQHIKNSSSGALAQSAILLRNNGDSQYMFGITSTGFTTSAGLIANDAFVQQNDINDTYPNSGLVLKTSRANPLKFQTNSIERGRFFAGGNFALGSTTDSGERLQVTGTMKVTGNASIGGSSSVVTLIDGYNNTIRENRINLYQTNTNIRGINAGGQGWILSKSTGTADLYPTALFAIDSTTQGFLAPRMTTTQKNAISSPAAGLVVYDTTLNKLCVYTTAWETITSI
jgi:hypothetical protein